MITLSKEQVQQLENFLLELPAKFANPIFTFLGQIAKEQGVQEEANDFTNNPNDPNAGLG